MLGLMYEWCESDHFLFSFTVVGNLNTESNNADLESGINSASLALLTEFIDNGFGIKKGDSFQIPVDKILQLDDMERLELDLPELFPFDITIQSDGQLRYPEFRYSWGFYKFWPNGDEIVAELSGPILEFDGLKYLLSVEQYQLIKLLNEYEILCDTTEFKESVQLKYFAKIKEAGKSAGCKFDAYLNNENVEVPGKIKLDLKFNGDVLEVIPVLPEEMDNEGRFLRSFDLSPRIKNTYTITTDHGERKRVVIDDEIKTHLRDIKDNYRKIADSDLQREVIDNPEEHFDGDLIDFSVFYSDRVLEIGAYKPKFYPFICPYKSEWVPGFLVDDKIQGKKYVRIDNSEQLDELANLVDESLKKGGKSVEWKGVEIPLEEANNIIKKSRDQFQNPKKPAELRNQTDVLIIEENAEELGFMGDGASLTDEIDYSFREVLNLNKNINLKNHQVDGIAWMQSLIESNRSGCLLADDMGLGKTLQILYFIEWHAQHYVSEKPYLIVAPVALLENWQDEYHKFFHNRTLQLETLYSTNWLQTKPTSDQVNRLSEKKVFLTNYETLRRYQLTLCAVDYSLVVLDEAQKIKTPGTLITNSAKAVKADYKIALTGTPVENSLVDLWCIMDFAAPGLLGNAKEFAREYQRPLQDQNTDLDELGRRLNNRIGYFLKRRLKEDVLSDLPKKEIHVFQVEMPEQQLHRYLVELENSKVLNNDEIDSHKSMLTTIHALKSISDHPYLLDNDIQKFGSDELISTSAKLKKLIDIIEHVRDSDEKMIVFAERKNTQRMLQNVIFDKYQTYPRIINGDTPSTSAEEKSTKLSRQQTVKEFEKVNGFNVIIMSPVAAGVGLNVTGANHVVHYSRHWNPAKEQQATDRAYRIGQEKDVHVYYPLAVTDKFDSFDVILDRLLERKKNLASTTLYPTESMEVKVQDMFNEVVNPDDIEVETKILTIEDVYRLNPTMFECLASLLYRKKGYETMLTPTTNDKGADVVATGWNDNYLIQCKMSVNQIDNSGVKDIVTALPYYQRQLEKVFIPVLFTNNYLSNNARVLAESSGVEIVEFDQLIELLSEHMVTINDLYSVQNDRYKTI